MSKTMKKVVAGMLVTMMSISVMACGSKSSGDETVTVKSDASEGVQGKSIKVLAPEEPGSEDALNNAIDKWAAERGVTVERIIISHDDQLTKFPAMAKNKDLPDLIQTTRLHRLYPEEFLDMGEVIDLNLVEEGALESIGKDRKSGKTSGLPTQYTITNLYCNNDAFEKAKIEKPTVDNPWTWEELFENAAKLQADGGVKYGFAADVSRARYDIMMYANGGSLVKQVGDTFEVNVGCAENVSTLERFIKANDDGVMPKAIWAGGSTDNPAEYFKNGDVAILLSGSWSYNSMAADITKFDFGVIPSPKGSVSQAAITGGNAVAIPLNAQNKDVAEDFVKWFCEEKNFKDYIQNDKGLSTLKNIIYEPEDEKAAEDYKVLQNEVNFVLDAFLVDESSAWRGYKDNEYRDYLKRAVSGELSAKEALDMFAKELADSSNWAMVQ